MQEVIGFCFGVIAVGVGVMGMFVIFSSILGEKPYYVPGNETKDLSKK